MTGFPTSRVLLSASLALIVSVALTGCGDIPLGKDTHNKMIVSVTDQKMMLVHDGSPVKTYPISTSKFGIGDHLNSNCTPLGRLQIAKKIGDNTPLGSVFKNRRPTGEILKPNAPGRDPVVTRILWLSGTEARNKNAFHRSIYIHGTPEEWRLGHPASFGCIRMSSHDVADLYGRVGHGADVFIIRGSIETGRPSQQAASLASASSHGRG